MLTYLEGQQRIPSSVPAREVLFSSPFCVPFHPLPIASKMVSQESFKLLERKKVLGVLFAEFLLYNLALALQGFSLSILGLFLVAGWMRGSRYRMPDGTKELPGPWGQRFCSTPIFILLTIYRCPNHWSSTRY